MINKRYIVKKPATTGVYIFYKNSVPLYIGKAVNIKARLLSHFQNSKLDDKERLIITNTTSIETKLTLSEFDALLLEAKLISKLKPKYNTRLKDDKSYLYIKITTSEKYPKVFASRFKDKKGDLYFGPFESSKLTEYVILQIRKSVPFCTQKKLSRQGCFYSKINLCNPRPNTIENIFESDSQNSLRNKYLNNIKKVTNILRGNSNSVVHQFEIELNKAVKQGDYERGILLRNKLYLLKNFLFNRMFYTEKYKSSKNTDILAKDFAKSMKDNFDLVISADKLTKYRIECFDISNSFGHEATGSMVVFEGGRIAKSHYKKFRIKTVHKISDFDMIEEVLERRFSKKNLKLPDLIIIDGGKPQLTRVNKILKRHNLNIPYVGIAKNPDRIIFSNSVKKINLRTPKPVFNLICEARDEAHRFAKKYHLLLRHKKLMI